MSTPQKLPIKWVTKNIIRQKFNKSQLAEKAENNQLKTYIKRNSHIDPPIPNEPPCTHSQIVYYYDPDGLPLAIVHQYRRPDGTIGGSGKPDPKRMFFPDHILSTKSQN